MMHLNEALRAELEKLIIMWGGVKEPEYRQFPLVCRDSTRFDSLWRTLNTLFVTHMPAENLELLVQDTALPLR